MLDISKRKIEMIVSNVVCSKRLADSWNGCWKEEHERAISWDKEMNLKSARPSQEVSHEPARNFSKNERQSKIFRLIWDSASSEFSADFRWVVSNK